ncbi:MAG TPA: crotonase/enoyl-CoA hydratase family protein [Labilithrix sp.]|nr:crotonase/enoyl-CoA hydratase family protein [Labilithrix sp.]
MSQRVRVSREGSLAIVTLTRPEKHNGVDAAMLKAVVRSQKEVRKLRDVRAVVLCGEGPSFCAGLDFKSVLGDPLTMARMYMELWSRQKNLFQVWSMGWRELGVPVIAVIHGNCFGAGIQLALGADVRVASPDSRISILEAKWGLVPDMGGVALLRELVRIDVAKELAMTGRTVSGVEAHALGLVSHVSDDPMGHARRLAAELETRSPDAVAAAKLLVQEAWRGSEESALGAERRWQRQLVGWKNQRIAVARNQKRRELPFAPRRIG